MNKKIQELVKQCHRPVLTADKRYLGETFDYEKVRRTYCTGMHVYC